MPLPQQVIEQLGREPESSHGWATGAILFSGGVLLFVAAMYLGMKWGYEPYVQGQYDQARNQVSSTTNAISIPDEQRIIGLYSQSANLRMALANHVYVSNLLGWLATSTEANVYYQNFDLSAGNRVSVKGIAKTEADVNQQIAVFENAPSVASVVVSNVSAVQNGAGFQFDVTLTMRPSVFASSMP